MMNAILLSGALLVAAAAGRDVDTVKRMSLELEGEFYQVALKKRAASYRVPKGAKKVVQCLLDSRREGAPVEIVFDPDSLRIIECRRQGA